MAATFHPALSAVWNYLYRVLWNWAGILLALDGIVALVERYFGEVVERRLHRKPHIPMKFKWGLAIVVFIIAQVVAYHDLQNELIVEIRTNNPLHQKITAQEQEIKDLTAARTVPPKLSGPSLKQKILLLANKLQMFSEQRRVAYEQRGILLYPDTPADKQKRVDFDAETVDQLNRLFGRDFNSAVAELRAKGLDVTAVEQARQSVRLPIIVLQVSEQLRELAGQIDSKGNLIR